MISVVSAKEVLITMNTPNQVQIKRIYAPSSPTDGMRILVDRLWPRGLNKSKANIDEWMKDIAPSPQLRQWFAHISERFPIFSALYERELLEDPVHVELILQLKRYLENSPVTLLYGAKNEEQNHARVLLKVLQQVCETPERV